jgi:AGCS family alanine or glycine:cation symporter
MNCVAAVSAWIWGPPMLILLVGGGLWLNIRLDFFPIRHFPFIVKQTFGKILTKPAGEGTISPFQAACSALASTVGGSNIIGVPVAIAFGGPGAVFWMWVTAVIGFATKFSEIALGLKYREKNEEGTYVGGPMYYLTKGLGLPFLGAVYAFFLMIELVPSISTQTVNVVQTASSVGIPDVATGLVLTVLVGLVVVGGIKRIGEVTSRLVPFMALLYIGTALVIILLDAVKLPGVLMMIFEHAFSPTAAFGGFVGSSIAATLRWGVARGCYSNEAGMGTAAIAHAAAVTDHPARQAMWGVFGIMVDTIIICTTTAMVVLVTGSWTAVPPAEAGSMTALAFQQFLGEGLGGGIVTICLMLFVISTIIVIIFFGEKQAEYLFGIRFSKVMRGVYLVAILAGSMIELEFLYQFLDILLATIVVPNMIGLVIMAGQVKAMKDEFLKSVKLGAGTGERRAG